MQNQELQQGHAKHERHVKVRAFIDGSQEDGVGFEMIDDDGSVTDTLVFDKKKDGLKKDQYHRVIFTLQDDSGQKLLFPSDKDQAMWVAQGTETEIPNCPESRRHHGEFKAKEVGKQRNTLEVHNQNSKKCYYKFSLNFVRATDTGEMRLIRFDPITTNKNGMAE